MRSGYRRVVCHDVVSLVIYYFHGREVGLPTGGMPRCREFRYIFSTIVRSGYRQVVCHDVVSLIIYYFHGREVRFTDRWFATMS